MASLLEKWRSRLNKQNDEPEYTNEYDKGQYWDAPVEEKPSADTPTFYKNRLLYKTFGSGKPNNFTPDPNYYQHKSIEDSTNTLKSSGLNVPAPDVAEPVKKPWWEHVTDPISSLQYGLAHGIKNAVDDNPETKALSGAWEGLKSGWSGNKNLEDRTSFTEVFDTMLGSDNKFKRTLGGIMSNTVGNATEMVSGSNPIGGAINNAKLVMNIIKGNPEGKSAGDMFIDSNPFFKYMTKQINDAEGVALGNPDSLNKAKDNSGKAGLLFDIVADPENLLDGYLKAPIAMIKGMDTLRTADKANDATKAASALIDIGKEGNMKQIEYLMKKTNKVLGGMPDYEGFKIAGKTVLDTKTLAKIGDKLGLSNIGKGLSAIGNSELGQSFNKAFRFGKNGEWINLAKQNPDDALKYVAQTEGIKDITNRMLKRKSDVLDLTQDIQKSVAPEEQTDMTHSLEGIMTPEEITRTVTETVVNPEYRQAVNKSRSKIAYQVRELAKQKAYLNKKLASMPEADMGKDLDAMTQIATLKSQLAQLDQELIMLNNIKGTVELSYAKQLKEAGIDVSGKKIPLFIDPSEVSTRNIDEVTELVENSGMDIENPRDLALRLKQAADNYIDNLEKTFPDLTYLYTKEVAVSDLEKGLAKPIDGKDDSLLSSYLDRPLKQKTPEALVEPKQTMTDAEREIAVDKWLSDLRKNAPEKPDAPQPTKNVDVTPLDESIKLLAQKADYPVDAEYFNKATWQEKAALRDKLNTIIKTNQRPLNDAQKRLIQMRLNQAGISTTKEDVDKIGYYKFQQILDAMKDGSFYKQVKEMKGWKDPTYQEKVRMSFADMLEYERVKAKDALEGSDRIKAPSMRTNKDRFIKTEAVDSKEIEKLEALMKKAEKYNIKKTKPQDIKRLEDIIADYKSKSKQTTGLERQLQKFKENSLDRSMTASAIIERYNAGGYVSVEELKDAKKELHEFIGQATGNPLYKLTNKSNEIELDDMYKQHDADIKSGNKSDVFNLPDDYPNTPYLYHGTATENLDSFVDEKGNLHLKPSSNFGGKQKGISFAPDPTSAHDYARRIKGIPTMIANNDPIAKIFRIDKTALKDMNMSIEAMEEVMAKTDKELIIPSGKWQWVDAGKKARKEISDKMGKLSNEDLAYQIRNEYRYIDQIEYSREFEGADDYSGIIHNPIDAEKEMEQRIIDGRISKQDYAKLIMHSVGDEAINKDDELLEMINKRTGKPYAYSSLDDYGEYRGWEESLTDDEILKLYERQYDNIKGSPLNKLSGEPSPNSPIASIAQFVNKDGQRVGIDEKASVSTAKSVLKASDELPEPLRKANKQINIVKADNGMYGANTGKSTTIFDTEDLDDVKNTVVHESTHAVDRGMSRGKTFVNPERTKFINTLKKEIASKPEWSFMLDSPGDTKNVKRAETIAEFAGVLLGSDVGKSSLIREQFPKSVDAFYNFINKAEVDDIMDEVAQSLPPRSIARVELQSQITKTKEMLKTFEDVLGNANKQSTIHNVIHNIDRRIKEFNEKMMDTDYLKRKNPDSFKDVPEFVDIEKEVHETILKPLALGDKAANFKDIIKKHFKDWADEEGIDALDDYVTHLLNWDLKSNKKTAKLYEDVFDPFDKHGLHRKIDGTIDTINKIMAEKYGDKLKGKPFFETLISRIYMERGMYHANFMFDKEYADQTMKLFGQRIDKGFYESLGTPERKQQYWNEIQQKLKDPNYTIVKMPDKYEPVKVKVLENGEIEEGYRRRTAKRETARLMETDNPMADMLNNMQINNRYIEIDPKQIKHEDFFEKLNTEVYVMPRDAYNAYVNSMKKQFDGQRGALLRMLDKVMSTWKAGAIMSPGFHMTNAIGNVFNSSLEIGAKILDPQLNATAAILQRKSGGKGTFLNKSMDEWREILQQYGMKDATFFHDNMSEFRKGELDSLIREQQTSGHRAKDILNRIANPFSEKFIPRDVNTKIGSAIESQARIVNFLAHVQAGKSYDEAADLVNKVLFDYQDLTSFEHNVMKRLVPFYTWIRKNTPLQIEKFMEDPTRYAHIAKTMRNVNPESEEEQRYKPEYLKGALHTGKNTYRNLKLPFQDLTKVASPSEMFGSMNPLIKMAVELGMNKNTFTGQAIDEGYNVKAPGLMKLLGSDSPKGKLIDPKIKYILQSLMPGANRINDVIQSRMPDATASEKQKVKRTWNPAHLSEFTFDTEQQKKSAMYDYMEKLLKEVEKARKEGRLK